MSSSSTETPQDTRRDAGFFGHPRPLASLFGVEMWERFSFYGMQGILLIYLYYTAAQGGLGIDEGVATGIVGAYGGAVYLSTILGAWLAAGISIDYGHCPGGIAIRPQKRASGLL